MASYLDLNARSVSAFLDASAFRTSFDVSKDRGKERYQRELLCCAEYVTFHIGINGTWSATTREGGSVTSYEGIGYHAYTAELLQAVLDSDCAFVIHRLEDGKIVDYDMRAIARLQEVE